MPGATEQDLLAPTRKTYTGPSEIGEDLMASTSEKRSLFESLVDDAIHPARLAGSSVSPLTC